MPVVPVGLVSRCVILFKKTFRIFNEGYDNYNLRHNIP